MVWFLRDERLFAVDVASPFPAMREGTTAKMRSAQVDAEPEPIYAVYPSRRYLSARVRAFLAHIESGFAARS